MFTKFKKGDEVLLNEDLTKKEVVVRVWEEHSDDYICLWVWEKVALSNNKVYNANDLTFYSKPLQIMATQMEMLKKEIEILKKKRK